MTLSALFMTFCLNTDLPCADIGVEYAKLGRGVKGQALLYRSGRMKIQISEKHKTQSERRLTLTMLHEVAHLIVYATKGPNEAHHGYAFKRACEGLALKSGMNRNSCAYLPKH